MSFKKGFTKGQSSVSKQAAGVTISGFSFKQLEEDEDDEDLTAFTGKYEKLVEESQKAHKKGHERTPSNSSVSSTSSVPGEIKSFEKAISEGAGEGAKIPLKPAASLPLESANSPIRTTARAKFETSKELFSGLKGKITDKISKTIEEFSGESSSSTPSPDKEVVRQLPGQTGSTGLVEKETVTLLHSSPPSSETSAPSTETSASSVQGNPDQKEEVLSFSVVGSETASGLKKIPSSVVKEMPSFTQARTRALSAPPKEATVSLHSSGLVEDHPLAKADTEDDFEDVIEPLEVEPLPKSGHSVSDDVSEFYDPHSLETGTHIRVHEEHFTTEPAEDFTGHPAFMTTTQLKPRSKIKRLMKKNEPKTSAIATMSGLHFTPDEEIASPFQTKPATASKEQEKAEQNSASNNKPVLISSDSTSGILLRQFSAENRGLLYQRLSVVAVVLFAYLIVPLPSYISGFIMGSLLASLGWFVYMWLIEPPHLPEPVILTPIEEPLPVPEMKVTDGEEFLYKVS